MPFGQIHQLFGVGAVPGLVEDFAQDPAGAKSRQAGQVDDRLGMPGAAQNAPFFRLEGEEMPGSDEIARLTVRVGQR